MCCKSEPAFIIFIFLPFHNPYMFVLIFCLFFYFPLFTIHFPVLELFLLIRFWVYWVMYHIIIKVIVSTFFDLFLCPHSVTVSDILFVFCLDDDGLMMIFVWRLSATACICFSVDCTKCSTHDWKEFRSTCFLNCSWGVELSHSFSQCLNLSLCFFLLLPAAHPHTLLPFFAFL